MGDINQIVQGYAEIILDGVNVGFTTDGVTENKTVDHFEVEVDQVEGVIKMFKTKETMTVKLTLPQFSFNKLRDAWDQEGASMLGGTFLNIGSETGGIEHTLVVVANAPANTGKTYINFIYFKAVAMESGELSFKRNGILQIPITFKILKDVQNDNRFGYAVLSNTKGS